MNLIVRWNTSVIEIPVISCNESIKVDEDGPAGLCVKLYGHVMHPRCLSSISCRKGVRITAPAPDCQFETLVVSTWNKLCALRNQGVYGVKTWPLVQNLPR